MLLKTTRPFWPPAALTIRLLLALLAAAGLVSGCITAPSVTPAPPISAVATPGAAAPDALAGATPVAGLAALPFAGGGQRLVEVTPAILGLQDKAPLPTLSIINTPTPGPTPLSLNRTENILILGTDPRPNMEAWRTDTIMVAAVDRTANQVGIVSIPRDLYVSIPGYGQERINAADYLGEKMHYPGGGPALVGRILADYLGLPTQHWVRIKQDGIIKLVNALGGVEVNLACPLYEAVPDAHSPTGYKQFVLPAGKVYLDGPTAKEFVTFRYITTDFGRERRQQQLIWAIRNRALRGDVLPRLPELWQALSDSFTTDLSLLDAVQLASIGIGLQGKDVHAATLGYDVLQDYTTTEGGEVLLLRDRVTARNRIAKIFAAAPLADVGKPTTQTGGCQKPPPGYPDLSATIPGSQK